VVVRDGSKAHKQRAGRNRKDAERALRKIAVSIDDGDYRPQPNIPFREWADKWIDSLERKATTVDSYRSSMQFAKEVLGNKPVRRLGPEDITRFNDFLRERPRSSPSTRARHIRVLGACLQAAYRHRYAASNPVRELSPAQKPRPERKEAAYFENDELSPLFAKINEGLYKTVCLVALKTGMRLGELLGLRWGDVDLQEAVIRIRRTYTDGKIGTPKNHERRDLDLTSDVVELLGRWWGECGHPTDEILVFPGDTKSGFISPSALLQRELYPAMESAASRASVRPERSARSTASVIPTRNGRSRPALRSPGCRGTSATRRLRSPPISTGTGSALNGSCRQRRWKALSPSSQLRRPPGHEFVQARRRPLRLAL
jgi:integrase